MLTVRERASLQALIDRSYLHWSTLLVSARRGTVEEEDSRVRVMLFHLTSGKNYSAECVCVCVSRSVFLPCGVGNRIWHSAESLFLSISATSQWDSFPQSEQSNLFLYWCENCGRITNSCTIKLNYLLIQYQKRSVAFPNECFLCD